MTPLFFAFLALAGGVGATMRILLDGAIRSRVRGWYPLGTTVVNASGSLLLGFVTALALASIVSTEWQLILGTGFLGGYTTFSTASFETVRLLQKRRYAAGLANGLGMLVVCAGFALLGLWLGSLL
ncbi:MAG: fluoride efflux transporter CrcB [Terrimesophilobacter sp.]